MQKPKKGKRPLRGRINIPVAMLEFEATGNTIWIHSPIGATVLRIKCTGKIKADRCTNNPVSHADIVVDGDINICVVE